MSACVQQENATTIPNSAVGVGFNFTGFAPDPTPNVKLQIQEAGTWVTFDSVTPNPAPVVYQGASMHYFDITTIPVPTQQSALARWKSGGLARIRFRQGNQTLGTVDDENCIGQNLGKSVPTIALLCGSHNGGTLTMSSRAYTGVPQSFFISRKATSRFSGYNSSVDASYPAGQARKTFADFKDLNGFNSPGAVIHSAKYFNAGDLWLGRDMNCTKQGANTACYVTNYGEAGVFNVPPQVTLDETIQGDPADVFATVAMEHRPGNLDHPVTFYVYDANGLRQIEAALDSQGAKPIPGACISCHGGTIANNQTMVIDGSKFLPFDLDSFTYSTQPGFTRQDQEDSFRELNSVVRDTVLPFDPVRQLIEGWYGTTQLNAPLQGDFNGEYVPTGWQGQKIVYQEAYAPYCRSCHIASEIKFPDFASFEASSNLIEQSVCETHEMPHAEVTQIKFWTSRARAYMSGALGWTSHCN